MSRSDIQHHSHPIEPSAYRKSIPPVKQVMIAPEKFDAVLFDMDGIVTKTADVHAVAWKQTFDRFMRQCSTSDYVPFDIRRDYHGYVDGKPRYEGVRSFLESRAIHLPWGEPTDQPGFESICGLGNLKNQIFLEQLKAHHAEVYDTTVRLIHSLKKTGLKVAVITASENAVPILQAANLLAVFDAKVDGLDATRLGLKGKPAPDVFLAAAKQLGVLPKRAVVVEDAAAGVEAGRNGSFGLVIGVDRNDNAELLKQHGADVIVKDLSDVGLSGEISELPSMAAAELSISDESWIIRYDEYVPSEEGRREALLALGNGYFATRAAAPESRRDDIHSPGTYLAGGYNRLTTDIGDFRLEHEDLVNLPNWLPLSFRIGDGEWFDLLQVEILKYEQKLNMREGVLYRHIDFRDRQGRQSTLSERRFVHMRQFHLAALETTITAVNWSDTLTVHSAVNGHVLNNGIRLYSPVNRKHLEAIESAIEHDMLYLKSKTTQSKIEVAQCARTRVFSNDRLLTGQLRCIDAVESDSVSREMSVSVSQGDRITVQKIASLFTSRDRGISEPGLAAREAIIRVPEFEKLIDDHIEAWKHLWHRFELSLETDEDSSKLGALRLLRLNSFHILQTASPNSVDLDVGLPARGWGGEGYQGHVFWDDLFVFPFLNLRMPEITQALLKYRYRRLDEARYIASSLGMPGACYPWQSGSSGREETPKYVWQSDRQQWAPDHTRLQIHVNAAIAFNIWRYYQATGNLEFMWTCGADMLLEIARFFAHFAQNNPDRGRYEIHGVVGPDEYHQSYPQATRPGINNNSYTNVMAVWVLCRALELVQILPHDQCKEICERLDITADELALWDEVSRKMFVPLQETGIISQFEGYEQLHEFPRTKDGRIDLDHLHRVLQEQGGALNQYKLSKQADVLMLFYLLSTEELQELFQRLGYRFDPQLIPENVDAYMQQTVNNSTLSRVAHTWVLSRLDRPHAWRMMACMCIKCTSEDHEHPASWPHSWDTFEEALGSDFFDIQGGTTAEGVHMGAMAGTIDIIQRCYTGIVTRGDVLWLNPRLPDALTRLSFNLHYRQQAIRFEITHETAKVTAGRSIAKPVKIGVKDKVYELQAGESKVFELATGCECNSQLSDS